MANSRLTLRSLIATGLDKMEKPILFAIYACGWSSIFLVGAIFFFIFEEAWPILSDIRWGEFFGSERWYPNPASGNEASYGIKGMIYGTLSVTIVAMVIAVPLGLGAAIYISEFASHRVKETLKVIIELLAAVPSIVWGFIGLAVMSPLIQKVTGASDGLTLLNGGIIVALMSVPLIVSISEDSLRAVPDAFREAALALGASRWEIVYRVLFPAAKSGLLAATMLGVGRAVGETMAVLLATGNANHIPALFGGDSGSDKFFLLESVKTLTATIASEMGEAAEGSPHYQILFVIGIVLLLITVFINVVSDLIVKGIRGKTNG